MYLQQSQNVDVVTGSGQVKVPIGTGLNGLTPSLPANDGSLAINLGSAELYYVAGNVWKSVAGDLVTLTAVGAVPNANGASITAGQVLNLQPASATFPGVVTTGAQTFGGTKTFSAIIAPGTNYVSTNPQVGSVANDGIAIDGIAKTITLELADAAHNGIVSTVSQTYAGTKTFNNGMVVTPVVSSPLVVNVMTRMVYGNLGAVTYSGAPGNLGSSLVMHRYEACGIISFGTSPQIAAGPGGIMTLTTTVPPEYAPTGTRSGTLSIIDNSTFKIGAFQIDGAGTVRIGASMNAGSVLVGFTGAGNMAILDGTSTYYIN